ncbi:hypothetical protein [Acidihalobacter ferrooxydans]|uniref:Lipoprotein SmpA/OmlA domain-containing protein n=1 Tax=Acidihalobacter ferrooxydans TaxID=1765967 RepID=A0A1P8UF73_9GAMM|nr:hypothetical protein [Acidihalobacter ferrooxydans]APZ42502.1 hypothetical protein BW247_04865 [Acidihalobacter ferrooxydans]
MKRALTLCLTALLGLSLTAPALAEILVLPNGKIEAARLHKQPHRGMTMQQVRKAFGAPLKILAPTPTAPHYPTINRWVYPDYTVYFANDSVIHTVVHGGGAPAGHGQP